MKLVQSILMKNPCYTAGRKITVKGLMLHSVGCPQPKASVFINSWNSASYDRACVHGFIDGNDGTVYQTLPWNHRGWHCGGDGNNTHIGVEMCEPACIKYMSGASFTCSDILKAILATAGGTDKITEAWYRVRKTWSDAKTQKGAFKSLANAKKCADENPGYSVFDESGKALYTSSAAFKPYLVKVDVSDLNIRKSPGTNCAKTGKYTGKGVFTIVEEADGKGASRWGLLKSYQKNRDGWISLDYARKV